MDKNVLVRGPSIWGRFSVCQGLSRPPTQGRDGIRLTSGSADDLILEILHGAQRHGSGDHAGGIGLGPQVLDALPLFALKLTSEIVHDDVGHPACGIPVGSSRAFGHQKTLGGAGDVGKPDIRDALFNRLDRGRRIRKGTAREKPDLWREMPRGSGPAGGSVVGKGTGIKESLKTPQDLFWEAG